MNKAVIWDLDGTLIDSYDLIVDSLYKTISKYKLDYNKESIYNYVKSKSTKGFIEMISIKYDIDFKRIMDEFIEYVHNGEREIKPILNANLILDIIYQRNILNFVYTHKGSTAFDVLRNNYMFDYFREVVTSYDGFRRKPSADALEYLINKYSLDKENSYYIGDRSVDVECAKNAGIKSVILIEHKDIESDIEADYIISDLLEIKDIIK